MNIELPKITEDFGHGPEYAGRPGWMQTVEILPGGERRPLKPTIRCNCGWYCGIRLHHVHPDGTVTASFFHTKDGPYGDPERGCEWHVWLKLLDYDCGDFPPRTGEVQ